MLSITVYWKWLIQATGTYTTAIGNISGHTGLTYHAVCNIICSIYSWYSIKNKSSVVIEISYNNMLTVTVYWRWEPQATGTYTPIISHSASHIGLSYHWIRNIIGAINTRYSVIYKYSAITIISHKQSLAIAVNRIGILQTASTYTTVISSSTGHVGLTYHTIRDSISTIHSRYSVVYERPVIGIISYKYSLAIGKYRIRTTQATRTKATVISSSTSHVWLSKHIIRNIIGAIYAWYSNVYKYSVITIISYKHILPVTVYWKWLIQATGT